jgi:hypothetical protein
VSGHHFESSRLGISEKTEKVHCREGIFAAGEADEDSVAGLDEGEFPTGFVEECLEFGEHGELIGLQGNCE